MKIVTSGKRKTSIAKAIITEGDGKVFVNKKNYKFLQNFDKFKIEEPLRIAENVLGKNKINFNVLIDVKGGGEKSQIDAARLALAKSIIKFSNSKEFICNISVLAESFFVSLAYLISTFKQSSLLFTSLKSEQT